MTGRDDAGRVQAGRVPTDWPGRMAAMAADLADRFAAPLYGLLLAGFAALFVLAARLLTMEADEAWILLSTAYLFGGAVPVTEVLGQPTATTGGLHLLLHGLLDRVTIDLFAHRLVSLAGAGALLLLVHAALRRLGNTRSRATMGTALFAAVPGFVLQAGLATGEVLATLLLIAAAFYWVRRGAASMPAALVTGALLGLACATRVNGLVAIPALVAYAVFVRPERGAIVRGLAAGALAAAIAGVLLAGYYRLGVAIGSGGGYLATAVGVDKHKAATQFLQFVAVANDLLPLALIAAVIGAWFVHRADGRDGRRHGGQEHDGQEHDRRDLAGVLLFMGVALLAAWILIAPFPHLRYLWPAIACIWLAGVVLLLDLLRSARTPAARLTLHGIVVAAGGYALIAGLLALLNGDSLLLVYQAMGRSPQVAASDRRFAAAADQRALAGFVAGRPRGARFYTFPAPLAFPTAYLSGRTVASLPTLDGGPALDARTESYLLIDPADFAIWFPERQFDDWRRTHTSLAFHSGGYAAFRIAADAPTPRARLHPVGHNDLF